MKKLAILALALLVTSASASPSRFVQESKSPDMCPMHSSPQAQVAIAEKHDHQAMMSHTMAGMSHGQDPEQDDQAPPAQNPSPGQGDQPGDTPTHRFSPGDGCSAVNPKAPNKERDGVNPNTVGCKCAKKCTNNQPQEDLTKENGVYVCKNACHKDRCSCPDPCKS